ncbi:MAG: NADPH:quinone oxidoreductase family protein [Bacteroidota bacterium]
MKALVCTQYGPPEKLEVLELPEQQPGPKEVLVQIKACSLNFPDTLIIQGLYQYKPEPPFVPGSDIAGVVKAVGAEAKGFSPGDEVFGLVVHGGFAEEVCVPANRCFPKYHGMDFKQAAAFTMTYATSYHALKDRARLKEGETLLVLGASGGVGITAVELGKVMGARVIAAASTAEKLALCKQYGADELINYQEENLKQRVKELTQGKGADVVYDPVGGAYSEQALRATNWKGRFLVVGFAAGDIPRIPLNLPLLKGCQIVGVFWGDFATRNPGKNGMNMMELIQLFEQGKINPHIEDMVSLEETPSALRKMMDRRVKGKIVLDMEKE